jgi:ABC-type transport system involved in multi-copper enzyme maturation permease subunit
MQNKILSLSKNISYELWRQPIIYIIIGVVGFIIFLSPFFTFFAFGEEMKMVKDIGLSSIILCGLLIAILSNGSGGTEGVEISILCKPIKRWEFLLSKFLGIASIVLIVETLLFIILELTLKINTGKFDWLLGQGLIFIYEISLILTMISIVGSLYLNLTANFIMCIFIFFTGHIIGNIILVINQKMNFIVSFILKTVFAILPRFDYFNVYSIVALGKSIPYSYTGMVFVYTLEYLIMIFLIATVLINRKEF